VFAAINRLIDGRPLDRIGRAGIDEAGLIDVGRSQRPVDQGFAGIVAVDRSDILLEEAKRFRLLISVWSPAEWKNIPLAKSIQNEGRNQRHESAP
jgi:hypothetical protein